jgi:hypothetical protein
MAAYIASTGEWRPFGKGLVIEAISSLLGGIPREGVIALLALVSLQVILQVLACVDLARRRTVRGGRKWVWVVVIIAGSVLGVVLYFALGRMADPAEAGPGTTHEQAGTAGQDALDRLYGPKSGKPR